MSNDVKEGTGIKKSEMNLKNLKKLLVSFQNPEKRLIIGKKPKVTAFEFDSTFHHLFLGFKNGEVNIF